MTTCYKLVMDVCPCEYCERERRIWRLLSGTPTDEDSRIRRLLNGTPTEADEKYYAKISRKA